MKQTTLVKMLAAGAAGAVALSTAFAQESATTVTTTAGGGAVSATTTTSDLNGTGVIREYTPGSDYIMLRSEASPEPVRYYYTKKTTIVDPAGRTVEWSALRPDMPVRYTYVKEGDRMVISRVTLEKPLSTYEKETTTTTTTTKKH